MNSKVLSVAAVGLVGLCLASEALAIPAAPTPIAPIGAISTKTPTFQWTASAGAYDYLLQVRDSSNTLIQQGSGLAASICSGGTCSLAWGTYAVGSYHWSVKARDASRAGNWSPDKSFTVQPPPTPVTGAPSGYTINPNPTYTWTAAAAATTYTIQTLNADSSQKYFLDYAASTVCTGNSCAVTPGTALPIGEYTWHMRAVNAAGGSAWSALKPFSVNGTPAPVAIGPSGAVLTATPTYSWQPVTGATGYQLQALNPDGSQKFIETSIPVSVCAGGTCAFTSGYALALGSYSWRVRGTHAGGGGAWCALVGISVQAPPAPVPATPNGPIVGPLATYTWTPVAGATSYGLMVVDSSGGIKVLEAHASASICSGSSCAVTNPTVLTVGNYTWQARSTNAAGTSLWSAAKPFTVSGPAAPVVIAPTGTVSVGAPTYSWQPSAGATAYQLQVLNPDGSQKFIETSIPASVCASGTCSFTSGYTLALGSYSWRVRGTHAGGGGAWCALVGISVQAPSAPVLGAPSGAIVDPLPTYSWTAVAGATSYGLMVVNSSGTIAVLESHDSAEVCSGNACAVSQGTALAIDDYTWQARSTNAAGTSLWSAARPFTVRGPTPPVALAPTGTVAAASPRYSWQASAGATGYGLMVINSSGGIPVLEYHESSEICSAGVCAATPTASLGVGDYTWYVRGTHAGGGGPWNAGTVIHVQASSWPGVGCGGVSSQGDFNGDGHTDRLCSMHGVTYVSLSTSTGLPAGTPWLVYEFAHPVTADFNNDGKTDVADWDMMAAQFRVALALPSGDGFAAPVLWGTAQAPVGDGTTSTCRIGTAVVGTGDFDGDGLTDVYCRRSDLDPRYFLVGKNTGSAFSFSIFGSPTCDTVQERIGAQDMDGDGLTDFTCITYHGQLAVQLSNGTSFVEGSHAGISASYCDPDSFQFTDLNADGAPDVVCPLNGNVALSTGRSFIDQGSFGGSCSFARDMFAADIDSDGIAEIVCNREDVDEQGNPIPQARDIMIRRWTGTQLLPPQLLASFFCNDATLGGGDFDGDGRTDLLCGSTRVGITGTTASSRTS